MAELSSPSLSSYTGSVLSLVPQRIEKFITMSGKEIAWYCVVDLKHEMGK